MHRGSCAGPGGSGGSSNINTNTNNNNNINLSSGNVIAASELDHRHHHHHHHGHHHYHHGTTAAMTNSAAFHWGAMLAGGMMQAPPGSDYSATPVHHAHHAPTAHTGMPMDLHVSQAFPYYRYRDEALCWTDRKPSMDDVGNPNSVNARILELRKEKSRDAARSRRGKENFEFYELAKMLPLPAAITSQLDKASIIRLTISYLKLRDFSGHGDPPWSRDAPPPNKSVKGANRVRSPASIAVDMFEQHQGTHILQSLDGFAMAVAADGRFLYISETVSIYLGLSQVEMTGSSIFDYVHQHDHAEVADQLGLGLTSSSSSGPHSSSSGLASPSSGASEEHGSSTANPDVSSVMSLSASGTYKGYDRAFCVRMKSTLTKRGCHFKSSGYRVVLFLCRLRPQYTFSHSRKSSPPLMGMVGLAIALPPPSVHEIRLEADMFVTRINFDFRIAHCEPKVSELLDYTADELTGKNLYTLCHGEDANRLRKAHMDLIHKGQILTHYYRLMNKSGGYTWMQTCATVVCNSKNADEQNIICVNYVISGREYANLIMDCCQLEDGVTGVKREDTTGNDPENGSPDADRGEGRNSGGPPNQHSEHPHRSPHDDRDELRGPETDINSRGGLRHDNVVAQLQYQHETRAKMRRPNKRKIAAVEESSSGEDDEEDDSTMKSSTTTTPNGRNHALSPASSSHSMTTADQLLSANSPKVRRTEDLSDSHPGLTGSASGASVKDLEQAMSKHLPGVVLAKADSPISLHQPTDFSTDALLKQQQQKSTIQWIGAHHHLGHLSPQQATAGLPTSALLRQLYANRESVIRANVHGGGSGGGSTRAPSAGGYYDGSQGGGPLPTPPGSEGSSTYGEHQFAVLSAAQKGPGSDAFTSLVSSYTSAAGTGYALDYHSAMTPPSSVSPRDKQQHQQHQQQQQQQQQQHVQAQQQLGGVNNYEAAAVYGEQVLRHQYEPAQPLPLKPQVYSAVHPGALDAYATSLAAEQPQFYHHSAAGAGFHLYHPGNKTTTNGWYSSAS